MVSVIVPVYNSANYLSRCVESILSQTYTNFELLLIDDGSNDGSSDICDKYLIDSRVRVIHRTNGGVSSARNRGLEEARGKWAIFVDSDDWVETQYLENLVKVGDYDYVSCYYVIDNCTSFTSLPFQDCDYNDREVRSFLELNFQKLTYPVCRRYQMNIIRDHHLRFNENIHYSEDLIFNLQYIGYVRTIRTIPDILYHYEKHGESLSGRNNSWEELDYTINVIGRSLMDIYEGTNNKLLHYYIWNILRKYLTPFQDKYFIFEIARQLKKVCCNEYVACIFNNESFIPQSKFRKSFNVLMSNKLFVFAAILLKIEFTLLKHGIINRN